MSKSPPKRSAGPPRSAAVLRPTTLHTITPAKGSGKSHVVKYPSSLNALRSLVGPKDSPKPSNLVILSRSGGVFALRNGEKPSPSERSKPSTAALQLLQANPVAASEPPSIRKDERGAASALPRLEATEIRDADALGDIVRIRRQMLRFSQKELADRAGVGRRFVSDLEAGKATLELGKALAVCQALRIALIAEMNDGG
ncbi:helix-turn-helix transcriptional regulator [Brevundimonas sp.]|uniref:helix-turn-helix transcriptional regulator n=1 Tax=Brevundimonas sp. TaxID=1871086 RepID=UPI0028A0D0CE|nr:helix-turn-helix transcriptional regulator [Brevundimonas sp.]